MPLLELGTVDDGSLHRGRTTCLAAGRDAVCVGFADGSVALWRGLARDADAGASDTRNCGPSPPLWTAEGPPRTSDGSSASFGGSNNANNLYTAVDAIAVLSTVRRCRLMKFSLTPR